MSEAERLQNAINLAVWHLKQVEHKAALSLLMRHYKESEESIAAKELGDDVCLSTERCGSAGPNERAPFRQDHVEGSVASVGYADFWSIRYE